MILRFSNLPLKSLTADSGISINNLRKIMYSAIFPISSLFFYFRLQSGCSLGHARVDNFWLIPFPFHRFLPFLQQEHFSVRGPKSPQEFSPITKNQLAYPLHTQLSPHLQVLQKSKAQQVLIARYCTQIHKASIISFGCILKSYFWELILFFGNQLKRHLGYSWPPPFYSSC